MITINGYTLLDEQADWSSAAPKWRLTWDTEIVPTLRGNEGRSALRPAARPAYSFTQQPTRIERQAAAAAAIRAALVSGKACAPIYGRASWLTVAAAAGAGALTIDPTPWPWAVGDWFVVASAGISEAHQITAVAGSILTLASGLGMALPIDTAVYPLIFGRPELEDITQTNGSISTFPIKITGEVYRPAVAPAAHAPARRRPGAEELSRASALRVFVGLGQRHHAADGLRSAFATGRVRRRCKRALAAVRIRRF